MLQTTSGADVVVCNQRAASGWCLCVVNIWPIWLSDSVSQKTQSLTPSRMTHMNHKNRVSHHGKVKRPMLQDKGVSFNVQFNIPH